MFKKIKLSFNDKSKILNPIAFKSHFDLILLLFLEIFIIFFLITPVVNNVLLNMNVGVLEDIFISLKDSDFSSESLDNYTDYIHSEGIYLDIYSEENEEILYSINNKEYSSNEIKTMKKYLKDKNKKIVFPGDDEGDIAKETKRTEQITFIGREGEKFLLMQVPYRNVRRLINLFKFILILSTMLVSILIYVISRNDNKKIEVVLNELISVIGDIENNIFTSRYRIKTYDEFDHIGESINKLSKNMGRYVDRINISNENLKETIKEKELIEQSLTGFISDVSHEIRTPLSVVSSYAQALLTPGLVGSEEHDDFIRVIVEETNRMNDLFSNLLELANIENKNTSVEFLPIDISQMINRIISKFKADEDRLQIRGLRENIIAYGDVSGVERVLINYIKNALKYSTPETPIIIYVKQRSDHIKISVSNHGPHIEGKDKDNIWNKFYMVDESHTNSDGELNSGIGLSIVKAIMDRHNSDYGFYNTETGVEFYFTLPSKTTIDTDVSENKKEQ